jgi:hypothetical protein
VSRGSSAGGGVVATKATTRWATFTSCAGCRSGRLPRILGAGRRGVNSVAQAGTVSTPPSG